MAIRDLLRHGGYKPTGRGKPASEYLVRARPRESSLGDQRRRRRGERGLAPLRPSPSAWSTWTGSARRCGWTSRRRAPSYVFNASGQEIDLEGLLCLFDADGPCANAVKDSGRTKTSEATTTTLTLIWGAVGAGGPGGRGPGLGVGAAEPGRGHHRLRRRHRRRGGVAVARTAGLSTSRSARPDRVSWKRCSSAVEHPAPREPDPEQRRVEHLDTHPSSPGASPALGARPSRRVGRPPGRGAPWRAQESCVPGQLEPELARRRLRLEVLQTRRPGLAHVVAHLDVAKRPDATARQVDPPAEDLREAPAQLSLLVGVEDLDGAHPSHPRLCANRRGVRVHCSQSRPHTCAYLPRGRAVRS